MNVAHLKLIQGRANKITQETKNNRPKGGMLQFTTNTTLQPRRACFLVVKWQATCKIRYF